MPHRDKAGLGKVGQGNARQDKKRQDKTKKKEQRTDPNCVKLIYNRDNASGFTRSPFFDPPKNILKHVGIYGFCFSDIQKISSIEPTELSKRDSLEQISWMENGFLIKYTMCYNESISIDTPNDLTRGLTFFNNL